MVEKKEFGRQVFHILVGLTLAVMFYYNILSPLSLFLGVVCGVLLSLISKRIEIFPFYFLLRLFEREEQLRSFPGRGMIFFFAGVLLVVKLFPKDIALASIMVLTFGDSISHLVGERFGRLKNIFNGHSKKLLEGTLAGTLAGFLAAVFFVPVPEAFLGSALAMIAEVIQIDLNHYPLDDNLLVPLVAGTMMYLVGIYV